MASASTFAEHDRAGAAKPSEPDIPCRRHRNDPAFAAGIEGPFDYIVLSDTIGMLDDIENALRPAASSVRSVDPRDHRLLLPPVGTDPDLCRTARPAHAAAAAQLSRQQRLPQHHRPCRFRADQGRVPPARAAPAVRSRHAHQQFHRAAARHPAALPAQLFRRALAESEVPAPICRSAVIVPCRNERGNIEAAVTRMPAFGRAQEIIYIEGNSSRTAPTRNACACSEAYAGKHDIKVLKQDGKGKGDAVRKGFADATGDILMILDADLTMPPEDLPKFYNAHRQRQGASSSTARGWSIRWKTRRCGSSTSSPIILSRACSAICSTSASPTRCAAPRS